MDPDNNRLVYASMWLSSCYFQTGEIDIAKSISEYYSFPPIDRRKTVISDSLSKLAVIFFNEGKYGKAIKYLRTAASIEKDSLGEMSVWYYNTIKELGYLYYNNEQYDKALECGQKAYNISIQLFSDLPEVIISTTDELIMYYGENGNAQQVSKYTHILEELYKTNLNENQDTLSLRLYELSGYYKIIGEYSNAIRLLEESINLNSTDDDFAIKGFELLELLTKAGLYDSAINVGERCLFLWRNQPEQSAEINYIQCVILSNLSDCYYHTQNLYKSIEYSTIAYKTLESYQADTSYLYFSILNRLAATYDDIGDYLSAVSTEEKAVGFLKENKKENTIEYAVELSNLAYYYNNAGDKVSCYNLNDEALSIAEKTKIITDTSSLITLFINVASNYADRGDYKRAVDLLLELKDYSSFLDNGNSIEYATILNNLSVYTSYLDDHDIQKLIKIQNNSNKITKELFGESSYYYLTSMINTAVLYQKVSNDTALTILSNVERLCDKKNDHLLILLYYNIANTYSLLGNHDESIQYLLKSNNIIEKNEALRNHIEYGFETQSALFFEYEKKGQIKEKNYWRNKAYNTLINQLLSEFPSYTSNDREKYLEKYSEWLYKVYPASLQYDTSSENAIRVFNAAILTKGLLLYTNQSINDLLATEDSIILNEYLSIKGKKKYLNDLIFSNTYTDISVIDSLYLLLERQERKLTKESKVLNDISNYYSVNYDSIMSVIENNELLVVFVYFPVDSIHQHYYALCNKKGYTSPHIYFLCSSDELTSIPSNHWLSSTELTDLIWNKFPNEFTNIKSVYFTPIGELNNIPIENVPYENNAEQCQYFSDVFSLYRLSSARELYFYRTNKDNRKKTISSISIFGGLNYDLKREKHNELLPHITSYSKFVDRSGLKEDVQYLPGTEDEIYAIKKIISPKSKCQIFTGDEGTENAFKLLSGYAPSIIHIATHGFYSSESMITIGNELVNSTSIEDRLLEQTGLYMSGANTYKNNKTSFNDGLLTAREIAELNLRGVDFVALSACQSGLGILQGDGVFGIQRALKKAGVNSILMSLWKINDEATSIFMTEFYKNISEGKSKQIALLTAQSFVRNYTDNNGVKIFNNPIYWAAFVLLDAID